MQATLQKHKTLDERIHELECEIRRAKDDIMLAEQFFNYAEKEYIDVAIYQLEAANKRYSVLMKEMKNLLKMKQEVV